MVVSTNYLKVAVLPLWFILLAAFHSAIGSTDLVFRAMAANLNGDSQTLEQYAIRTFQGVKPDVVAIQEFNRRNNTPAEIRNFVDEAFGPEFSYYRETGYQIPNGIISRYPIVASGSWPDAKVSNRAFAWARIDLPGTNDLFVVSVHLLTSSSGDRSQETASLKGYIQSNFPPDAWIIVAGDMNTDNRNESALATFKTFLSDSPIPTDAVSGGKPGTNKNREKPYDYVLPSFSLAGWQTNTVMRSVSFPNGLVFDSRVYQPLADVAPVEPADSGNGQHMGVLKDFQVPVWDATLPGHPFISLQPTNVIIGAGQNASFAAAAGGQEPLVAQWYQTGQMIPDATSFYYTRTNVQAADLGAYTLVVTNSLGSATSAPAVLSFWSAPAITNEPGSLSVEEGQPAIFTVGVQGTAPFAYQWFFQNAAVADGNGYSFNRPITQMAHTGAYQVVISNTAGSATSRVATLTVLPAQIGERAVIARWAFNNTTAPLDGPPPDLGSGTASLVGGTTATFATGAATDINNINMAWNTTAYPTTTANNLTAGAQFRVSTVGRRNIEVRWDNRASSTGSKYARLVYSTNGGTSFLEAPPVWTNGTAFETRTNRFGGLTGVDNNPSFTFRIVAEFENTATGQGVAGYVGASGNYAGTGTLRFDMVTVSGEAMGSTADSPRISSARALGIGFALDVAGTTGAAYVLESSPAPSEGQWQPILTNTAPFSFVESNRAVSTYFRARLK